MIHNKEVYNQEKIHQVHNRLNPHIYCIIDDICHLFIAFCITRKYNAPIIIKCHTNVEMKHDRKTKRHSCLVAEKSRLDG